MKEPKDHFLMRIAKTIPLKSHNPAINAGQALGRTERRPVWKFDMEYICIAIS